MTITVYVPTQLYERRLRALAAWWCMGSSGLRRRPRLSRRPSSAPLVYNDVSRMSAYAAQYRLARAVFDYLTGLDPSAVGLVQTLLSLIPNRRPPRGERSGARGTPT